MTDPERESFSPHAQQGNSNSSTVRGDSFFLTGFMGAGKSTVGQALARRLEWRFADLDDVIEAVAGQTIPEIFREQGEDGFRDCEHAVLREQAEVARCGDSIVLALGGGTYTFERNRDLLRAAGVTIWLDVDPAILWDRVRNESHRPLAQDRSAFLRLHASRQDAYGQADFRVDAAGGPEDVAERIARLRWERGLPEDARGRNPR